MMAESPTFEENAVVVSPGEQLGPPQTLSAEARSPAGANDNASANIRATYNNLFIEFLITDYYKYKTLTDIIVS